MDDLKFNNFMADLATRTVASKSFRHGPVSYWDVALGERRDEIIALYTERRISKRVIFESLMQAGIIEEEKTAKSFIVWMETAIRKMKIATNSEPEKIVSVNSAKISTK